MKKLLLTLTLIIAGVSLFSEGLTGREIADSGKSINLSGETSLNDGELFIESDNVIYQLHLGPLEYSGEIGFTRTAGVKISVLGYSVGTDLAPNKIIINGIEYIFRDETGRPMWSGRSYTSGRGSGDHS